MEPATEAYLIMAAQQIGALSAFLGGFAATLTGSLSAARLPGRGSAMCIGASAVAAVLFVVALVAATGLGAGLHPDAPASVSAPTRLDLMYASMGIGFMLGVLGLLAAIGAAGWIRSARMGWLTTVLAGAAASVILSFSVSVQS